MGLWNTLRFAFRSLALSRAPRQNPERILRVQQRRLRRLVRLATARTAFFRAEYQGIDPERFQLADLPPTCKPELMSHFDDAVTDPAIRRADLERFVDDPNNVGRLYLGRYVVSHTSGSQGQPLLMVQEPRLLELFYSLQFTRGNAEPPGVVEAIRRWFRPARLAVVTMKRGFYPSAVTFEYMPAAARRFVEVLRLSQFDGDLVERLNAYRPTAITAYAGALERLALEALAGGLRLQPELRQITNNSEKLTDAARARIEEAFPVHVLDNYATGECPFLSTGCRTDEGAHVNADWAILEVVDEHYRPVPPGEPGSKVLITNLANTVQPIIRYEVGDQVVMANEPCACGSRLPRIARIEGRASDLFWVLEGTTYRPITSSVFKQAFDHLREMREWQAVQEERNRIEIRLEPLPGALLDLANARRLLDRQLDQYGLRDLIEVELESVPQLLPDPKTGKHKRMVSRVGPPPEKSSRVKAAKLVARK